jgi:hypothetical protein
MTPPISHLDGISSAGIYAFPSSMSIKIKGNSEIECKVNIQNQVFWSTKIEDSGSYRYGEYLQKTMPLKTCDIKKYHKLRQIFNL